MRTIFTSVLIFACLVSPALGVPVVFNIDSGSGIDLTIDLTQNGNSILLPVSTNSASSEISGTIEADLGFDGTGNTPTSLVFGPGGQIVFDDSLFLQLVTGLGALTANSADLKATLSTLVDPNTMLVIPGTMTTTSASSPFAYDFDLAEHELNLNDGTFDFMGTGVFASVGAGSFDFATDPAGGSASAGTIATMTITDLGGGNYQAVMPLVFSVTDTVQILPEPVEGEEDACDPGDTCAEYTVSLDMTATANFSLGAGFDPGDFDEDGDIDGADFLLWQRGGTTPPLDPTALADWEAGYGSSGGGPLSASIGNVPEPSSLVLLGLALGLFPMRTAKRRLLKLK